MTGFRDSWLLGCFVRGLQAEFFEIPKLRVHWHIHDSQDFKMANHQVFCNPQHCARQLSTNFDNEALAGWLIAGV